MQGSVRVRRVVLSLLESNPLRPKPRFSSRSTHGMTKCGTAAIGTQSMTSAAQWSTMWLTQRRLSHQEATSSSESLPPMPEVQFHAVSDKTLHALQEILEEYLEQFDWDSDVEYSQGVLKLQLGDLGTYIINKQTPNRQIWMSSPVSGPLRYDYIDGLWKYKRDGHVFHKRLEGELLKLTGAEVDLSPCVRCEYLSSCTGDNAFCGN